MRQLFQTMLVVVVAASAARAQSVIEPPARNKTVNLSGPRFGMTALGQGVVDELERRSITVRPNIAQFGWQFEKQFYSKGGGLAAVNEWVFLAGGLEQGVVLPSLSWLVGLRTREGAEFGIGPNVTPAGVSLVLAAGLTMRTGTFNVPVNVAVVPSRVGTRVSVLTGFNMRR